MMTTTDSVSLIIVILITTLELWSGIVRFAVTYDYSAITHYNASNSGTKKVLIAVMGHFTIDRN